MPNYIMCDGQGCLLSLNCKRYHPIKEDNTEYFTDAPYRVVNGKTECAYQWIINETENEERRFGENEPNGIEETKQDS